MVEIPLTQGKVAIVDDEDAHLAKFRWFAHKCSTGAWSVRRTVKVGKNRWTKVTLHQAVMGYPKGQIIDHKNGNPFDCRRSNLRIATHGQNSLNRAISKNSRHGFKGIRKYQYGWAATIAESGSRRWLGSFGTAEEAARAYDSAARELHGEFAAVNFPEPGERGAREEVLDVAATEPAPGWRPASPYEADGCCRNGHPATPDSIQIRTNERGYQYRACLTCRRESNRKADQKRKQRNRLAKREERG